MISTINSLRSTLLLLVASVILITGCGIFGKDKKKETSEIENFDRFYDKFHRDESFQMSRIDFPIEGKMVDNGQEYTWTKENWMPMKVKIYDIDPADFKTTYDRQPTAFYQKFWTEDAGFFAEYRFELRENKWYLVYAKDVNL